jgi:serine/threonine-protein kinase RIM15
VQGLYDLTNSELQAIETNPEMCLQGDTASIHSQDSIFGDNLPLEEDTVTPLEKKQVELEKYTSILDIINVALLIPTPDSEKLNHEQDKSKMIQIIYWRAPQADDADIESLILDIEIIIKSKVEAVNRMKDCLMYNERTRRDFRVNIIQDPEWSEFILQEKPEEEEDVVPPEQVEVKRPCTPERAMSDIVKGTQNIKQNIFKKIKDWKKSKGKRKQNKKLGRKNGVSKVLEMEVIETPMASPKFPPSLPTRRSSLTQRIQKSGSSTPSSMWKSPLSPLPAPMVANRPVAPSIKDFDIIKPISKGAFGSVFLAKKRVTGDYYAIKFLKKSDMIAKNQVTNVKAERMILMTQTDSPFVTKLYYTFQSKDYLYLVMEYLNGGDCSSLIKVLGSLPLDWARNYLAEVALGLSYLHDRHIIHRYIFKRKNIYTYIDF